MLGNLIGPDIAELIAKRDFVALRKAIVSFDTGSVAELLEDLPSQDLGVIFRILPRELAADIFEYLSLETQEELIKSLGQEQVAAVLNEMDPDDRTALLEELPGKVTQRLLTLLTPQERQVATQLLGYPEDSIGRRMTPDYVAVNEGWTIGEVLQHIRKVGHDRETLDVIFVVDDRGRLVDDLRLREIILADPAAPLSSIMDGQFSALRVDHDQEEAVREFQRLDRVALPVVDSSGLLVGMVTVDDVMDVAEEEATEDMQKMAGVNVLDAPYQEVGILAMVRKRLPWLLGLVVVNVMSGAGIAYFEDTIAAVVALVFFLPLLIGSAGNAGSQSATLVIRAMATGDVGLRDWLSLLGREVLVALCMGVIMSLAVFVLGYYRGGSDVAWVVALTMSLVVLLGSLAGMSLPFVLTWLRLDPAAASAPLVTSLADVAGVLIYFSIAAHLLRSSVVQ